MRLRHLAIRNFRGIRNLDWAIPNTGLLCLIGRGDSTKSTVLEAIRRVLYPQWNLLFDDSDFHKCDIENPIVIEAVLGDIPDAFRDLTSGYGSHLCGWDAAKKTILAEAHRLEEVLQVRLAVTKSLEPTWMVVRAGNDTGVRFDMADRAKTAASLIDSRSDHHLTWSKGSILSHVTEKGSLTDSLAEAARAARRALDSKRKESLTVFDDVAAQAEKTARSLGVTVASGYTAHLDTTAINIKQGALAIHDGPMPLRQLGLGSKRLLSTGLSRVAKESPHITLFDEIEVGLEPHRIARLVHHLKDDQSGQYFVTTHSPVAVREFAAGDLHVVHHTDGVTMIHAAAVEGAESALQGNIRKYAEAFLAPKVLVCEGATEVGVARALDHVWQRQKQPSFAYQGVAPIDAGGASKVFALAIEIRLLHYDVAILADSDGDHPLTDAQLAQLKKAGIAVIAWEGKLCTERRVFEDLKWPGVMASFQLARANHNDDDGFLNQIAQQFQGTFDRQHDAWTDTPALREALGKAARASKWFKAQYRAAEWIDKIGEWLLPNELKDKALGRQLRSLRDWVDRV